MTGRFGKREERLSHVVVIVHDTDDDGVDSIDMMVSARTRRELQRGIQPGVIMTKLGPSHGAVLLLWRFAIM